MRNKTHIIIILCTLIPGVILALGTITGCKKVNNPQPEAVSKKQSKFIAVARGSDKVAYSEDGITWTETKMPSVDDWYVCSKAGMLIALGGGWNKSSDKAAYSEDGINWKTATLPNKGNWDNLCYGNGKFVTVARNSNKAAYSLDGINWQALPLPKKIFWISVSYGDGKFVAISDHQAAYSEDGINWKLTELPYSADWGGLHYDKGKFMASDYYESRAVYSKDGIKWFKLPSSDKENWGFSGVCYGNGKFVAVSRDSTAYSEDEIHWKTARLPVTEFYSGDWSVMYGNERFVAIVMGTHVSGCDIAMCSEDGINWKVTKMSHAFWDNLCYGNGKFLAAGLRPTGQVPVASDIAAYTEDGINWKEIKMPSAAFWTIYYCEELK